MRQRIWGSRTRRIDRFKFYCPLAGLDGPRSGLPSRRAGYRIGGEFHEWSDPGTGDTEQWYEFIKEHLQKLDEYLQRLDDEFVDR